jgi:NAD-dependent dihydropyrimidine dehydrogenase PreA subunit
MSEEKLTEEKGKKVEEIKKDADAFGNCPVLQAHNYVDEFLKGPMCGRCFPCSMGSYEARERLKNLIEGNGTQADVEAIKRISVNMALSSFCKKGKDTAKFLSEWMAGGSFEEHAKGKCASKECRGQAVYSIIPELCNNCGECLAACKYDAIIGEKKVAYRSGYLPFEIRQARCTRCGECVPACPKGAIVINDKAAEAPVPEASGNGPGRPDLTTTGKA